MPSAPILPATIRYAFRPYRQGMAAELLVRAWLALELDCDPIGVALLRDALGRPQLGGVQRRFDVNWSHSGNGLLVALGDGVQVGADLERIRPRPRALALARRFFAPAESERLAALPQEQCELAFIRLWCAKEAVLKAHGRGLAFGLDQLVFDEADGALQLVECGSLLGQPRDWSLQEFEPESGYRAAIAWRARRTPSLAMEPR